MRFEHFCDARITRCVNLLDTVQTVEMNATLMRCKSELLCSQGRCGQLEVELTLSRDREALAIQLNVELETRLNSLTNLLKTNQQVNQRLQHERDNKHAQLTNLIEMNHRWVGSMLAKYILITNAYSSSEILVSLLVWGPRCGILHHEFSQCKLLKVLIFQVAAVLVKASKLL